MHTKEEKMEAFGRLLDVLDRLRVECPWDRKQTNESLRPNTIEETFELCDALMHDDNQNICKELGDVLMHVCFYSLIGQEKGDFDIADVCNKQADKLIFRHPHVYGKEKADTAEKVLQNWEQIKLKEKDGNKTVLSGVPEALPSLIKAYRIQDKARNVGFDWEKPEDVWDKVREELEELEVELKKVTSNIPQKNLGISCSVLSMQRDFITSIQTMLWSIQIKNSYEGSIMWSNIPFVKDDHYHRCRSKKWTNCGMRLKNRNRYKDYILRIDII